MKSKTKSNKKSVRRKPKHYPHHYLVLYLVLLLLVEGVLFNISTPQDWVAGISLLDISTEVSVTAHDIATIFQPIADVVDNINQFYNLAAISMIQLLDLTETFSDVATVFDGVNEFYAESSTQLTQLLDLSGYVWPSQVAGASINVVR
jgi:hypothetical protein